MSEKEHVSPDASQGEENAHQVRYWAWPPAPITPAGEQMHLLTEQGMYVGAMQDIGVYYHGELHDEHEGWDSLPATTPSALWYMASKIFEQLASERDKRYRKACLANLKCLSEEALRRYERAVEEDSDGANPSTTA